jgi:hemerythrin-like metal-binding protein
VEWNEGFESGLADIDVQHRYIFALIKRVKDLDRDVLLPDNRRLIDEIASYAMCHFACEERLMAAYAYQGTARHVEEHARLLFEVRRFQSSMHLQPKEFCLFLCNWVVEHTLLEDRVLATYVIRRRAEALEISVEQYVMGTVPTYRPSGIMKLNPPRKDDAASG